ncbi:Methionine import system permease protein MetP [Lentilactobacillus parabuchneri]|jgi:D-methionine transport system permease protein|uniref:ABC transporter permease subunit n=1 Tax=Lentilactobacillus parabuchneri TaxID=152331 RepID=A0A1X1FEZ4_9LACO|nr:methionine ABC transporter permease [Lentilactobacillus parabuchneri]APR07671.1 Methionine import system permease protein MetP [Lentilactobacillus parabuchneri]MBW0222858.1 ABC transporter permease [Lentilactobacillus parabuchneri]MBW0246040.1 ABC transporter permease [Lentilactobacillus parabuchneri]MBW0263989.1 ABC transporter permease [Lentilactobacillus parabuchneri]MCT2884962.1 ABC transporter permease [Lentilactobacillus parabuchneri]
MLKQIFPNVAHIWPQFVQSIWDTIYMTVWSALIAGILGLTVGIVLVVTQPGGIAEDSYVYGLTDKVVNLLRSIPFIILLAVMFPITNFIVHTTVGTTAALVPLVVGIFPFYARQVQNALLEIDPQVIEAARSMGSGNLEIIFRIYLREGLPDLIRASIVTIISLIGLTTMAGAIGSGGLGDVAISIGYARYQNDVTIAAMLVILIMVFLVQFVGDWLARKTVHL